MPVRVVSSRDQQTLTVNSLVANPLIVPERIIDVTQNQFIMDQILRDAGTNKGAVQFRVSSGIFADDPSEIVAEGAEIPLATVTRGDLQTKPTQKRALGVGITWEMRNRNQLGEVDRQIQVVKNTLVRDIDSAFFSALSAAVTQTRAATATWATTATATIRKDINAAKLLIKKATAPGAGAGSFMAFNPTHLLLSVDSEADLLNSPEFTQMIYGQVNPSNVSSLADIPDANILGLKPLVSPTLAAGTAYVVEAKAVGGYSDERPLQATELYEEQKNELWRSDASRITTGFIDQPLAVARITGT
jgi:hypothetical protein